MINLPSEEIEMNCTWSTAVGPDSNIEEFLLVHSLRLELSFRELDFESLSKQSRVRVMERKQL